MRLQHDIGVVTASMPRYPPLRMWAFEHFCSPSLPVNARLADRLAGNCAVIMISEAELVRVYAPARMKSADNQRGIFRMQRVVI